MICSTSMSAVDAPSRLTAVGYMNERQQDALMKMLLRGIGGLMMVYAALYLAQYLFSALYDNPQRVWDVMNVVSGVGILIVLAVNLRWMRSQSGGEAAAATRWAPTRSYTSTPRLRSGSSTTG